jgi:phage shock protein A
MTTTTTRRHARTESRLKAKAEKAEPKLTRTQRTAEQRIADLEAQIEQVKRRAAAKKVKKDPALRHVSGALRSIDKALASSEDKPTREALSEARTSLAAILTLSGAMVPAGRARAKPRGVGPVIEEDALLAYIKAHPGSRS